MEFTLGQIVTSVTGEYEGKLKGDKPKPDTRIKIYAEEKKDGYGSNLAIFGIEYNYIEKNNTLFIVVNKIKARGKKYQPIFKTECKKSTGGKYTFQGIQIDTDTLFDDDEDQECLIQAFKYRESGYHVKICEGKLDYKTFKNLNGQSMTILKSSGDLNIIAPHI